MPVTAALITGAATVIPSIIATGTKLAESGAQFGLAAIQNAKAKKIAQSNIRPEYIPNKQIVENKNLAASLAGKGLPDATLQQGQQMNERNLSQSLSAILRSGGDGNQISDLYQANGDIMLKLAAMDAEAQKYNIAQYLSANEKVGQENQTAWMVNKYGPYANQAQLAATLRANAVKNATNAINGAATAEAGLLDSQLYNSSMMKPQAPAVDTGLTDAQKNPAGRVNPSLSDKWLIKNTLNKDSANADWDPNILSRQ